MGLDAYFHRVHKDAVKTNVDFKVDSDKYNVQEVHYFRKNFALQGWMRELYRSKGGVDPKFNCCNLLVALEDLLVLRKQLKANKVLPTTMGFFGGMHEDNCEQIKQAVSSMIANYNEEYVYYYYAWY
jgi:hypothetical protein